MTKYNGEKIIRIITKHIAKHNFPQEIKENLMINAILPAIKEIENEQLIDYNTIRQLSTNLITLKNFIEFNNILCSPEFIEFVKNYNK